MSQLAVAQGYKVRTACQTVNPGCSQALTWEGTKASSAKFCMFFRFQVVLEELYH